MADRPIDQKESRRSDTNVSRLCEADDDDDDDDDDVGDQSLSTAVSVLCARLFELLFETRGNVETLAMERASQQLVLSSHLALGRLDLFLCCQMFASSLSSVRELQLGLARSLADVRLISHNNKSALNSRRDKQWH